MKLFVGLGNPGREYAKHRHNVGFMAVDRIGEQHDFGPWKSRFQGDVSDGRINGTRVLLLKPQTYMNESGRSVAAAARYLKIAPEDVVVFYDEIDLAPGKLKVKVGGGNAGHNGLRSITQHFDNDYQRVRIGVGRPNDKAQVANHVLSNFSKADQTWLDPLLDEIAKASTLITTDKSEQFLSAVVRASQPERSKTKGATKPDPASKKTSSEPAPPAKPAADGTAEPQDRKDDTASGSALGDELKSWMRKITGGDQG